MEKIFTKYSEFLTQDEKIFLKKIFNAHWAQDSLTFDKKLKIKFLILSFFTIAVIFWFAIYHYIHGNIGIFFLQLPFLIIPISIFIFLANFFLTKILFREEIYFHHDAILSEILYFLTKNHSAPINHSHIEKILQENFLPNHHNTFLHHFSASFLNGNFSVSEAKNKTIHRHLRMKYIEIQNHYFTFFESREHIFPHSARIIQNNFIKSEIFGNYFLIFFLIFAIFLLIFFEFPNSENPPMIAVLSILIAFYAFHKWKQIRFWKYIEEHKIPVNNSEFEKNFNIYGKNPEIVNFLENQNIIPHFNIFAKISKNTIHITISEKSLGIAKNTENFPHFSTHISTEKILKNYIEFFIKTREFLQILGKIWK